MKSTLGQDLFAERIALPDGLHSEPAGQARLCLILEAIGNCQLGAVGNSQAMHSVADCESAGIHAGELWVVPAQTSLNWRVGVRLLRLNITLGLQSAAVAMTQFGALVSPRRNIQHQPSARGTPARVDALNDALNDPSQENLEDASVDASDIAILRPLRLLDSALPEYVRMAIQPSLMAFEAPFLNSLAQTLFIHLAAKSSLCLAASLHSPAHDQDAQSVAVLRSFVDERLAYDLGVEDLARQVQMSKFQLLRVMKKHFSQTPQQFVIQRRIERAKSLLRGSNASLADIAFQTGFSSQSHLSNTFKQLVGNTPKAYRDGVLALPS
jgi:AraC-like DNA-binding protein